MDENGTPTGRTVERGQRLNAGEYHLVVDSWIVDKDGGILITKRSPEKTYAGLWEPTTGCAIAGESSIDAIKRETREEVGIELSDEGLEFYGRFKVAKDDRIRYIRDVYIGWQDFRLGDVILQKGETSDAMRATPGEIRRMVEDGSFLPSGIVFYYDKLLERIERGR